MQKTSVAWVAGDPVTAAHLNQFGSDLSTLFAELSNENLTFTYDVYGQISTIVDSENSITINFDWSQISATLPKLYIQKAGDPKKWTVSYDSSGIIQTIVYA